MVDARALVGRVHVEPLDRNVLSGVIADRAATDAPEAARTPLDLGVLPVFADERPLTGLAAFLDWRACGKLSALVRRQWWTGAVGECVLVPAGRTLPVRRIVLFGLGASDAFDTARARAAAAAIVEVVGRLAPRDVLFAMPGKGQERVVIETVFEAALATMGREAARGAGAGAGADADADAGAGADADAGAGAGADVNVDVDLDVNAGADAGAGAGAGADVNVDLDVNAAAEVDAGDAVGVDTDSDTDGTAAGADAGAGAGAAEADAGSGSPAPAGQAKGVSEDSVWDGAAGPASGPDVDRVGAAEATCTWWVIADPRHVARLRRVLEGPPRAAGSAP